METRYVSSDLGDDSWTGEHEINVPPGTGPYKTIQHGVDELAKLSDPVRVLNVITNQYNENIRMHGVKYSGITVVGFKLGHYDPEIAVQFCEARPLVDGQQTDNVFSIKNVTKVVLKDLCIQNGKSATGAGVEIRESQVDLISCCIRDNTASDEGGGFGYFESSTGMQSKVENCRVTHNGARRKGGGGIIRDSKDVVITKSRFLDNFMEDGLGGGGLCLTRASKISVEDYCLFEDNKAGTASGKRVNACNGGAIYADECSDAPATIYIRDHNTFHNNKSDDGVGEHGGRGGAIHLHNHSYAEIVNNNLPS